MGKRNKTDSKHEQVCRCASARMQETNLFGTAFKHHILLALVQPPLPHCPEVQDTILPLQQLIQDV